MDTVRKELLMLYESQLPHGYKAIIADRLGVSRMTVSNFFKNRTKNIMIENEVLNVIAELNSDRKQKLKAAGLL